MLSKLDKIIKELKEFQLMLENAKYDENGRAMFLRSDLEKINSKYHKEKKVLKELKYGKRKWKQSE